MVLILKWGVRGSSLHGHVSMMSLFLLHTSTYAYSHKTDPVGTTVGQGQPIITI